MSLEPNHHLAGKVPPRRIRTAPAVGGAYMRARLNQIKELTGYQVGFGRIVASDIKAPNMLENLV